MIEAELKSRYDWWLVVAVVLLAGILVQVCLNGRAIRATTAQPVAVSGGIILTASEDATFAIGAPEEPEDDFELETVDNIITEAEAPELFEDLIMDYVGDTETLLTVGKGDEIAYVSDEVIRWAAEHGRVCEMFGHRWGLHFGGGSVVINEDGTTLGIDTERSTRICEMCGQRQEYMQEWVDVEDE